MALGSPLCASRAKVHGFVVHQQWKPTPVTGGAFSLQQVKVLTPLPAGKPDLILLTKEDAT